MTDAIPMWGMMRDSERTQALYERIQHLASQCGVFSTVRLRHEREIKRLQADVTRLRQTILEMSNAEKR